MLEAMIGSKGRLAAAVACAAVFSQGALAADTAGKFAIKGAGLQSCAAFLKSWDAGNTDVGLYGGWIDGYLTGLNQFSQQTYDLGPWQTTPTLLGLTKSVCDQSDPATRFMDAFFAVVRLLQGQRLETESAAVGTAYDGKTIVMYATVMERIKARLIQLGELQGDADATFNAATADALKRFQASRGLEVTGLPDQPTLYELLSKSP